MDETIIRFGIKKEETCKHKFSDTKLKDLPLTMVYAPMQPTKSEMYEDMEGLKNGTIFKNLDKPFLGKRVKYN